MGLKSFRALIGPAWRSSSLHTSVMGALVPVPLVPMCAVGDVDRRESPGTDNNPLSIHELSQNTFCHSVIRAR